MEYTACISKFIRQYSFTQNGNDNKPANVRSLNWTMDDVALNVELKSDKMKIFVTGKFGVGKSTFINGLFSGKVEAEIGVRSRDIRGYTFDGVTGDSLVVYDTPGQELNSTSYLQWIEQNCSDVDLVFFCVQMSDQIRPEDTKALASLAKTFERACGTAW